jgi:hypothetical protein
MIAFAYSDHMEKGPVKHSGITESVRAIDYTDAFAVDTKAIAVRLGY